MGKKRKAEPKPELVGFLGVGLDGDGETRLTKSEHFFIVGGSKDTHEHMQDTAIRFDEKLRRNGKTLSETPLEEVIEIFHESRGNQ